MLVRTIQVSTEMVTYVIRIIRTSSKIAKTLYHNGSKSFVIVCVHLVLSLAHKNLVPHYTNAWQ